MTATDKSPDESSSNGGTSQTPVTLQTPFLYQNSQTGQSSSAPLTARQLCRILCPAKGSASTSLINPQTLLIGYDPVTHTYDSAGWRTANSTPLLREACLSWYYESREGVKGPVSTRELAGLLRIDTESEDGSRHVINEKTRVFPTDSSDNGQWARIQDLALLKLAIEALAEVKSMPMTWPANDEESPNEKISNMTYNNGENDGDSNEVPQQKVHDELEAFLSSTDHLAPHAGTAGDDGESDGEEYESDGGTRYVRDSRTGNWVHEALAPKKEKKNGSKVQQTSTVEPTKDSANALPGAKKRKRSKPKFSAKNARNWIYVTGLPANTNEEEVANYFSKVGILELDPETQKPSPFLGDIIKVALHPAMVPQCDGEAGTEAGETKALHDLALELRGELPDVVELRLLIRPLVPEASFCTRPTLVPAMRWSPGSRSLSTSTPTRRDLERRSAPWSRATSPWVATSRRRTAPPSSCTRPPPSCEPSRRHPRAAPWPRTAQSPRSRHQERRRCLRRHPRLRLQVAFAPTRTSPGRWRRTRS